MNIVPLMAGYDSSAQTEFNGLWQLALAKKGEAPPIGKDLPERILVPFPVESALSGVMKRADRLWYRPVVNVRIDRAGGVQIAFADSIVK